MEVAASAPASCQRGMPRSRPKAALRGAQLPVRVSCSFGPSATAPRAARHFVTGVLGNCGAARLSDSAALVVTELATNAVLHAASEFEVVLHASPACVRISVADCSPHPPAPVHVPPSATAGRGLEIVSSVADRWGTECRAGGKVVWAELRS